MNDYFHRVAAQSSTRLWINNATPEQAESALERGAVGATTNPTYAARVLREDSSATGLLEQAVRETKSDGEAVDRFTMLAVARLQAIYQPLYEESSGQFGFVAIQGDPRVNDDANAILAGAARYCELGPNMIIKVPATPAGARAMKELTAMNVPTIATLGFSVDQALYMAEAHREACRESGHNPPCFVTYIAGILDECLGEDAKNHEGAVPPEWVAQAGCQGTRVAYRLYRERGYGALLLGGGARETRHFSELVGGHLHVTIGWSLADELAKAAAPVEERINSDIGEEVEGALSASLPNYRKASRVGQLQPEDFTQFCPVAAFQCSFLDAMDKMLERVRQTRAKLKGEGGKS